MGVDHTCNPSTLGDSLLELLIIWFEIGLRYKILMPSFLFFFFLIDFIFIVIRIEHTPLNRILKNIK